MERTLRASLLAWVAVMASLPLLSAQDKGSLSDRLRAAQSETALDGDGLNPWHLTLNVQLFDSKGKPSEQGTIDEWWASKNLRKITYDFPSYSGTRLRNADGAYQTKDEKAQPSILLDVLNQVVDPINLWELETAKPDLRKEKFGKSEEDCIMIDRPLKNVAYVPVGLFPTYCLDAGKNDLRASTELGSITFIRNRTGRFQTKSVAVDLTGESQGVTMVTAHLSVLSGAKTTDADFAATPEMEKIGTGSALLSGGVITGSIINKIQPVYPASSKANRVQGSVVLRAIIGTDGHVHSLHIVSTPDPDLAISAISAVRQWTYRPYLLYGMPTEVDTTITVNFAFGPG